MLSDLGTIKNIKYDYQNLSINIKGRMEYMS